MARTARPVSAGSGAESLQSPPAQSDARALVRQAVLAVLDVAQDGACAIDSVPVPVVQFHLAPTASSEWAAHAATFGNVVTKKHTIFGYKLHLLVTLRG